VTAPFRIRPATPADQTQLGELAGQLVRLHSDWNSRRFLVIDNVEVGYGRWLVKEARSEDAEVLVAVREEAPADVLGYAYFRHEARDFNQLLGPHTVLHDLFVGSGARGGGVATALLHAVRDASAARKCPRILLHTAVQNAAGQALFRRVGFEPTMVEMTWELHPPEPT